MARHSKLLLGCLALLPACASEGPFPSLQYREIERRFAELPRCARDVCPDDPAAEPAAASSAPAVLNDPALQARIAALAEEVRRGQQSFASNVAAAERAVSRAGAAGTESWIAAQQELSGLEAARGATAAALGDLEALAVERASAATNAENRRQLEQALSEARAIADAQRARTQAFQERLSRP